MMNHQFIIIMILVILIILISIFIYYLYHKRNNDTFHFIETTYFDLLSSLHTKERILNNLHQNNETILRLKNQYDLIYQEVKNFETILNDLKLRLQNRNKPKEISSILSYVHEELDSKITEFEDFCNQLNNANQNSNLSIHEHSIINNVVEASTNKEEKNMAENTLNEYDQENFNRTQIDENELSIFSLGLVVNGDVSVTSPFLMKGQISGNLTCKQNVTLEANAFIKGDVKVESLTLTSGKIHGNVDVTNHASIEEDTYIKGDINANSLDINGDIEGNVTSQSEIVLYENAKILGDVCAMYITMEKGAKVVGKISIGNLKKINSTNDNVDEI